MSEFGKGLHLVMDLAGCNKERLADMSFLTDFVNSLPQKIGMTLLKEADPVYCVTDKIENDGISLTCILCESHVAIHCWHNRGFVMLDISSCKQFNVAETKKLISDAFEPKAYEAWVLDRGGLFNYDETEDQHSGDELG